MFGKNKYNENANIPIAYRAYNVLASIAKRRLNLRIAQARIKTKTALNYKARKRSRCSVLTAD